MSSALAEAALVQAGGFSVAINIDLASGFPPSTHDRNHDRAR
jgi:hypothetical protein